MELIDKAGAEIFLDRGDAAADANVLAARRRLRLLECGLDPIRNEVKVVWPCMTMGLRALDGNCYYSVITIEPSPPAAAAAPPLEAGP